MPSVVMPSRSRQSKVATFPSSGKARSWERSGCHRCHMHSSCSFSRIEMELGAKLADLDRVQKQIAIRMLEEQGAFLLRKSIEYVAQAMDVSRITIYNYLNAIRD